MRFSSSEGERRAIVTGAAGMLGRAVADRLAREWTVVRHARVEADLADLHATVAWITGQQPSLIVHCAAWADVDGCEQQPDRAWRDNAWASRHVALASQLAGASLCHVSTDYVFDGSKPEPYAENDSTSPLNVYGETKLAAELQVTRHAPRAWIVRTSWLFGPGGKNFVRTVAGLLRERDEIQVVDDQRGAPTHVEDLAGGIAALVRGAPYGVYHATNAGAGTWYDVACTVRQALGTGGRVRPCTTAEFPRPARRPRNSRLAMTHWQQAGLPALRSWSDAVRDYVGMLARGGAA